MMRETTTIRTTTRWISGPTSKAQMMNAIVTPIVPARYPVAMPTTILYTLVDLNRRGIRVKEFVRRLEQTVIDFLGAHGVPAERRAGAPGVYVDGAKIAALGVRVTRGRAWHGLALNVEMDLAPFGAIDPCGFPGLKVVQARDFGIPGTAQEVGLALARRLDEGLEHA